MHGASLPPYRLESPAPLLPRAPLFPKLTAAVDELAEHLALPPGLGGETHSLEGLPTSILEARVHFTMLSRELGLDYRLKRGLDLRADVSGIEAMQSVLLESFPDHVVRTSDEAYVSGATGPSSARSSRGDSKQSGSTSRRTSSGIG
jgi:hypothetical protein